MKLKFNKIYEFIIYIIKMTNYKFVSPINTDFYISFNYDFSNYLIVNFFQLPENKGLIIDQNNNKHIFDLTPFNINWNSVCACIDIGQHCVDFIKQFYPNKEVFLLTARTVSNDGSIEVKPTYFLFYGFK